MLIRRAKTTDSAELANLYQTNMLEPDLFLADPESYDPSPLAEEGNIAQHSRDNHLYLVVDHQGQIAGSLIFNGGAFRKNYHTGSFGMSIRKEYRGQGLGKKLITELFKWAKKNKIKRIELEVWSNNSPALALYKKMGFQKEGVKKRAYKIKGRYVDGIIMAKIF